MSQTLKNKKQSAGDLVNIPTWDKQLDETLLNMQRMERTRLSNNLRDNINQILAATKLYMELLEPQDNMQEEIKMKTTNALLLAINEINKLSNDIGACRFKETGLIDSINDLIDEAKMACFNSIAFTCLNRDIELVSPCKKVLTFRVIREILELICKNNLSRQVEIYLQFVDNRILIVIDNELEKFEPSGLAQAFGLNDINELVSLYKGYVNLHTASQRGLLEVSIPVN